MGAVIGCKGDPTDRGKDGAAMDEPLTVVSGRLVGRARTDICGPFGISRKAGVSVVDRTMA